MTALRAHAQLVVDDTAPDRFQAGHAGSIPVTRSTY